MNHQDRIPVIEAILFAAGFPVKYERIAETCEITVEELSALLDSEAFIEEAYVLEVSSPGLGRVLKRPRDFEYACGRMVEIRTYKPVEKKKEWTGVLTAWDKETVTIEIESEEKTFERNSISLIRLAFDPE